jgi:hypothetical protein
VKSSRAAGDPSGYVVVATEVRARTLAPDHGKTRVRLDVLEPLAIETEIDVDVAVTQRATDPAVGDDVFAISPGKEMEHGDLAR